MEKTFDELVDICYKEQDEGSELISVSVVVKDSNSNEYGGISEYNENFKYEDMGKEQALLQYSYEVSLFEAYGTTNVITFKEWVKIKGITLD